MIMSVHWSYISRMDELGFYVPSKYFSHSETMDG